MLTASSGLRIQVIDLPKFQREYFFTSGGDAMLEIAALWVGEDLG